MSKSTFISGHAPKAIKKARRAARKDSGVCRDCANPVLNRVLCSTCQDKVNVRARARTQELKQKAVDILGGMCKCCGVSDLAVLCNLVKYTHGASNVH